MSQFVRPFQSLLDAVVLAGASLVAATIATAQIPPAPPAVDAPSQASYANCQPPSPGEYLLLVMSKTVDSQEQVRRALPPSATVTVCNYLSDVVTRVGGFTTAETANAWATYMKESIGLSAFVARPSEVATQPSPAPTQTAAVPTTTSPVRSPGAIAYSPQALGGGYAVLVDYFSRPELATQVQQLVGKDIGLASYRQRPYLLAVHTTDQSLANATLQTLTNRGFWAMVVDSRRVTLLRSTIATPQSTVKK